METKEKKTALTKFDQFELNPFMQEGIFEIQKHRKTKNLIARESTQGAILNISNPETGELLGHTAFVRKIFVDDEKFTKIYTSRIQVLFDLSTTGFKVFGYIADVLKKGSDEFYFDHIECGSFTKLKSRPSMLKGLTELLEAGIIARRKNRPNFYFINPNVLFNGDRILYADLFIKKSAKQVVNPNQTQLWKDAEDVTNQKLIDSGS
jgi:hypothetical protein